MATVKPRRTETELIALVRRGDAGALAALYEQHGGALLRLGARLTANEADAEDLLHDLFVGLPELLGHYEDRGALAPWLRGVMTQLALGRLRQTKRREGLSTTRPVANATEGDPWNAVDLERAIAALPESLRTVFVLRHVEEHPHEHIAALLGISAGASRVRHLRALRQLRAFLEPGR
jgi:RNA polymerase sigma-70 factor (ECF subfamily)